MFEWWRERRRAKILEQPFPAELLDVLERNVKHYLLLSAAEQKQLHDLVQVFVAEKSWEGCGGLTLTDEMKVTIAACTSTSSRSSCTRARSCARHRASAFSSAARADRQRADGATR